MAKVKGAFLLILAIALILLGITFINTTFKNIKAKTTEVIDTTEVLTPTLEDPLKLEYTKKEIKIGGSADLTISFMNPTSTEKNCQLSLYSEDGVFLDSNSLVIYNHNPTSKIRQEQIAVWKAGIEDKEGIKQTKILTVAVCCADSYAEGNDVSCSADINNGVEFRDSFVLNIG